MKRISISPRENWQSRVEELGLTFHTTEDGTPYWDESVYYQFDSEQIDEIERASYELERLCLEAVDRVVTENLLDRFHIPEQFARWIAWSWETEERTIIGRFDLAYAGAGKPKLLEYNADTPTSLLEAAVVQWHWFKERFASQPDADQFNQIHERLIEAWSTLRQEYQLIQRVAFLTMNGVDEDEITTTYLRDTAIQGGWETMSLDMADLGFDQQTKAFVDLDGRDVELAFKLYPWEWMLQEKFGMELTFNRTRWLEAPWKMILSNKALLPLLWEMFPDCPYLLPAYNTPPVSGDYVAKPIFGREGANVTIFRNGNMTDHTDGDYADGPMIYQAYTSVGPLCPEITTVIGSWMVNGYAAGIGIRESESAILGNLARFVPHVILPSALNI